jgi:hypothetical protein
MSNSYTPANLKQSLDTKTLEEVFVRLDVLSELLEFIDRFRSIHSLERALDKANSVHYVAYLERVFTSKELESNIRYKSHRLNAFRTPLHFPTLGKDRNSVEVVASTDE